MACYSSCHPRGRWVIHILAFANWHRIRARRRNIRRRSRRSRWQARHRGAELIRGKLAWPESSRPRDGDVVAWTAHEGFFFALTPSARRCSGGHICSRLVRAGTASSCSGCRFGSAHSRAYVGRGHRRAGRSRSQARSTWPVRQTVPFGRRLRLSRCFHAWDVRARVPLANCLHSRTSDWPFPSVESA